jgi:uncharacterized protein (TIRG00374 family)
MNKRIWDHSLLVTAIAVTVISALSVWLAWSTSSGATVQFSGLALIPIVCAALISYSLRSVRFFYFLSRSGVIISLRSTILVQSIGFALSVTPGHIGEVFKLHLIRERTGTPIVQSAPLLLLDRVTEGGGFMILAILSAFALPSLSDRIPVPTLTLTGLGILFVFALTFHRLPNYFAALNLRLSGLALWQRSVPHVRNLWHGLKASFTLQQILGGLGLSALARFADGVVVLLTARMLGVELALPVAIFVLAVSGLAGGVSFLPAGIGAVETTMVGLLVLQGTPWSIALVITLLVRLGTLWLWVALGLILAFLTQLPSLQPQFKESKEL